MISQSPAPVTKRSLTQLALVGIAAGFLAHTAFAADQAPSAPGKEAGVSAPASGDTTAAMPAQHGCKGENACKGMGGCKMSKKDLKAAAKKMGMETAKAGKAHDCKGKNECKGLGGCKGT
jgi:hypothetical protein